MLKRAKPPLLVLVDFLWLIVAVLIAVELIRRW